MTSPGRDRQRWSLRYNGQRQRLFERASFLSIKRNFGDLLRETIPPGQARHARFRVVNALVRRISASVYSVRPTIPIKAMTSQLDITRSPADPMRAPIYTRKMPSFWDALQLLSTSQDLAVGRNVVDRWYSSISISGSTDAAIASVVNNSGDANYATMKPIFKAVIPARPCSSITEAVVSLS